MDTSEFLPKDDQDLQLALRINEANESMQGFGGIEDPLLKELIGFKHQKIKEIDALKNTKGEIWNEISKQINSDSKPAKITSLHSNIRYWAVAATILIAAFVGIFWFANLQQQPTLIAESGNQIEMVTLADGSEISLRPNSALYEVKVSDHQRAYRISGEGFFSVAKDTERPFTVAAGEGTITVLGTRFNVSTWGNSTNLYLEEGSVKFSDQQDNNVVLAPGEKAVLDENGITAPEQTSAEKYKDWLDNTLVLESTSVNEMVAELEHHFSITIDISEYENPTELISGSIALENENQTLNDLGTILGGTFRKVNTDTFAFIPLN